MAAYPPYQSESSTRVHRSSVGRPQVAAVAPIAVDAAFRDRASDAVSFDSAIVNRPVDLVVDRVAAAVVERLGGHGADEDESLDSRHAAEYLGVHRDTLRKLAAERAIPAEQDGPGCKLYFRRSDLDASRRGGGRPRHLASTLAAVA